MAQKSAPSAVERVRAAERIDINLPVVGRVRLPRPEDLAYYGALGVLAVAEILDWPVALLLAAGHALAENEHSRIAAELGQAMEEA
ncbi:MAG: hypothetical protein QOE41_1326 [Mycobacterium sp.]|jgi:hypothetical protein|nr:hypothetical protein [Mycobacterium sp.]MDT5132015.1 hypothetical protein [Mycobacterium sp.]